MQNNISIKAAGYVKKKEKKKNIASIFTDIAIWFTISRNDHFSITIFFFNEKLLKSWYCDSCWDLYQTYFFTSGEQDL